MANPRPPGFETEAGWSKQKETSRFQRLEGCIHPPVSKPEGCTTPHSLGGETREKRIVMIPRPPGFDTEAGLVRGKKTLRFQHLERRIHFPVAKPEGCVETLPLGFKPRRKRYGPTQHARDATRGKKSQEDRFGGCWRRGNNTPVPTTAPPPNICHLTLAYHVSGVAAVWLQTPTSRGDPRVSYVLREAEN